MVTTAPTRVHLSWSGGKDSAFALHQLRNDSRYEVVSLITTVTRDYDRISIHGVRRSLLAAQAAALGLPVHEVEIPAAASNAIYEAATLEALERLTPNYPDVTTLAFGDLFLEDVRAYREQLLARSRFTPLFPIWGLDTAVMAREVIALGFVATLVCVDTHALDAAFAGRRFDGALLDELPAAVDPCGERGEFHTFVSDGPGFSRPIPLDVGPNVMRDGRFIYCDLAERAQDAG
jgi:uncharacterized protein (TIGR00290 family)